MKGDKPTVRPVNFRWLHLAILWGVVFGITHVALYGCDGKKAAAAQHRVCRPAVKVQRVVHHAAVQQVVATPVYYQVGAHVQQQAQFHTTPEYDELLELRGFRAGVEAATRQQQTEPQSDAPPVEGTTQDAPAAPSPTPAVTDAFADRYPTLARTCARCHTGDDPKGGVWLDGTDPLDDDELAAIARAVVNGRMPKGHAPLEPQTEYDLLVELFTEWDVLPSPEPE